MSASESAEKEKCPERIPKESRTKPNLKTKETNRDFSQPGQRRRIGLARYNSLKYFL